MKRLLVIFLLIGMLFVVMPVHTSKTLSQDGIKLTVKYFGKKV